LEQEWQRVSREAEAPPAVQVDTGDEGVVPQRLRAPEGPSQEAIAIHNLAHIPAAAWCQACTAAKTADDFHSPVGRVDAVLPVVQADYWFIGGDPDVTVGVDEPFSRLHHHGRHQRCSLLRRRMHYQRFGVHLHG